MRNYFILFVSLLIVQFGSLAQTGQQNRVIILTDIEADPDDTQSLVRLLLYSNQIEIKGLVATTSCWLQNKINPESIARVIRAYEKVQPNLLKHEAGYPKGVALMSLVKKGLPLYGMQVLVMTKIRRVRNGLSKLWKKKTNVHCGFPFGVA